MAEPDTSTTSPASPYDALGISDGKTKDVTAQMAATQREKVSAEDKVFGEIESTQARMLPRIEQLSKDAGVEAGKMKPWNADEESAKRRTDPIEAFGSIGSVFGILASAFTHAPMENALNASAAAINSIKQGDKDGYERAYKAWQDNTKQTLDRHKIQHEAYQDAVSLLQTNMAAANTKLQVLAARFGDKQTLTLLENGMSKELQELLQSRQTMALQLAENLPKIEKANAEMSRLFALGYDPKNPTTEQSQQALQAFRKENAELKRLEHPYYGSLSRDDALEVDRRTAKYEADGMSHEEARDKARMEIAKAGQKGGAANLTTDRQRAQDVAAYREELKNEKNEDGTPKYKAAQVADMAAKREAELKRTATPVPPRLADDLTSKIERIGYMEQNIDKVEALLKKHKALTGLGGTVTRPGEVITNWFGSNETDRAQFRRYVSELQEWAPRVLNDSAGRPLSSEAAKVQNIIAGISPGDTTANTARAYKELRDLLAQMKVNLTKRRERDTSPTVASPPPPPAGSSAPWLRDPVVPGKRSAIESESEIG